MTNAERGDEVVGELRNAAHQAAQAAPEAARQEVHRRWKWMMLVNFCLVILIGLGTAWYVTYSTKRQNNTDAQVSTLRTLADQSKQSGEQANDKLKARGQTPVPIPNPGTASDSDVITAAATAKVLASLPNNKPTAAQLGQAVGAYLASNPITPVGPTPNQISSSLAGYFVTNPPPAGPTGEPGKPGTAGTNGTDGTSCDPTDPACVGPQGTKGDKGDKGDSPTEAEIQQAIADYLAAHPDALCPRGGVFTLSRVQTADGGSQDAWSCVVTAYPSPTAEVTPTVIPGG